MKKWKKLLLAMLVAAVAVVGVVIPAAVPVEASSVSGVETRNLPLDDIFQPGTIAVKGAYVFYKVTLPSDGWLTVTYQGWDIGDAYYQIAREDFTKSYGEWEVWTSTNQAPKTSSKMLAMEKGSYIIRIRPYGDHTGNFKIKASFAPANNNEKESNDEFVTAESLSENRLVTGFFSEDDRVDFYRLELNAQQTVRVIYTSRVPDSYVQVWNQDYTQRYSKEIWTASEEAPLTHVYEETLSPGVYYIKIMPYGGYTGRYTIQWQKKILTKSISISSSKGKSLVVGKKTRLTAKISPSNATVKDVVWTSSDDYAASIDQNGLVTTKRPGIVKFTATAQDGSNKAKTFTLTILPKKVQKLALSTYRYNPGRLNVRFEGQAGSSGYEIQYSTNSSFKGAKSKKVTSTNYTITRLKKNKKYYVRVRAYVKSGKKYSYGAWSAKKSIKVK